MKAGVIGAGAWGTALAQLLAADGQDVRLWALEADVVDAINGAHENPLYLPGLPLSPSIRATGVLSDLADRDLILVVSPAQHLRSVVAQAPAGVPLVLCSKGIEAGTGLLMSEVAAQAQPTSPIAVLSGPTFAHEVAKGLPTAVTFACADQVLAEKLAARIARPTFRPYLSDDVVGAEIGGDRFTLYASGVARDQRGGKAVDRLTRDQRGDDRPVGMKFAEQRDFRIDPARRLRRWRA